MVFRTSLVVGLVAAVLACGGGDDGPSLADFLPPIPDPTGEAPSVFAGEVTSTEQLLPGESATGMVGDFYLRNRKVSFIIQSPARVLNVIPQGGNLVDAVALGDDGRPLSDDHFGELSAIYLLGRTCEHQSVEVVRDGSGGGVAAIRAIGVAATNDFLNMKGLGILPFAAELDPDVPDSVECATTYILHPDATHLEVYWTLFNGGERVVQGPFATITDTGGEVETWAPTRGFERLGIEAIAGGVGASPIEYSVFQAPGVAYGLLPLHGSPSVNSAYLIAGISVILFGVDEFLKALTPDGYYLYLGLGNGVTNRLAFSVGRDAADADAVFRALHDEATVALSGTVAFDGGAPAAGARVGVFADGDGDGQVGPRDLVVSYLETRADGSFAGRVKPGRYVLRADLFEVARSSSQAVDLSGDRSGLAFALPRPVEFDYTITDAVTGDPVPGKLTVLGEHPARPDPRLHTDYDRVPGLVTMQWSARGTTTDIGDGADPRLVLPSGGTYRVIATRGPEWSFAIADVAPQAGDPIGDLDFALRRVLDTAGYLASEYHVHSIGSPDSPVPWGKRILTAVADGVELWASTEHEWIADPQPLVEQMGLASYTRAIPGEEVSPFVYGHFIGFPLQPVAGSPNFGAVDWARGAGGFAMLPSEIMATLRDLGAQVIQVNHPRTTPSSSADFQAFFERAVLTFDYASKTIGGDPGRQPVPNDYLRLEPGAAIWSFDFNALEVWNSLEVADTDGDGVRDLVSADQVMRDWFNFLSFGAGITPLGNSDTHTAVRDPVGIPRTMVRVPDDSPAALADGSAVEAVIDTLAARGGAARDVVVTNGPMIRVTGVGDAQSVLGKVVSGAGGVTLRVTVQATTYAPIDTIEVFANATPDVGGRDTHLEPIVCFTTRTGLLESDPCGNAPLGTRALTVQPVSVGGGVDRLEATVDVALTAAEVAAHTRAGATGQDAWVVVRARGQRGIFPIYIGSLASGSLLATLVRGSEAEIDAALVGKGLPASAFTAPVLVDFDGGGYRAPFAPQ
jgi:hypothetical protein